ncbi:MAG: exosome complex protein Rrp42 [Desulfurococcaceae archaeon]|jgi:exosome complex component RRP42
MSVTPERELYPRMYIEYIVKLLKRGERIDNRGLLDYRPISVILNPIEKAEGSALVRLGKTQVLVGVKLDLGAPFRDRPSEGVLQVHAEFVPLASPSFEPGPPDENAIELARVVDRSIREPKVIKLDELVIEPERTVWVVYNDIYLVDHAGNAIDASMLASMLALATTKIPSLTKTEQGYRIDKKIKERNLPISTLVATVTMAIIGDVIIVDPTLEEETISDSILTIAVDEKERVCGAQKKGEKGISRITLEKAVDIAIDKSKWLISYMKNVLNNPQEYTKPLSEMGA